MARVDPATAAATRTEATRTDLQDERRRFALVVAGLEMIDQGFSVFDRDLRAVAVNKLLYDLYEIPQELRRVGTPFADIMRANAMRGEYGEGDVEEQVAERVRLARQFTPHYVERVRPDGTVLAIRGTPLPEGGWVTTYTDVTRQHHDERVIREQNKKLEQQNEQLEHRVRERTRELENAIAERKRLEAALVHAQKMEAVGALAGGLAHDFNNFLMIVINKLAALRERAAQGEGSMELVQAALDAAQKSAVVTGRLLAFARRQSLEPRIVEVNGLIANLLSLARHALPAAVHITTEPAPFDLHARVDPEQLEHSLLNLVLNARDAMPQGGSLVIHCTSRLVYRAEAAELGLAPGRYVEFRVEDTGMGMDQATLARAFDPFFTTKSGSGSGLGLSMVYGFAKQSGGTVHIRSTPGKGTTARLLLPASRGPTRFGGARLPEPRSSKGASRVVLLVEDNADVRTVIRRQLMDIGHRVIEAPAGDEALAIVTGVPDLSVLVSDIVMPGAMDGRLLAQLAKARRPELGVVLVTGYADGLEPQADRYGPFTVLRKPCTKVELATAIESAAS